MDLNGATEDIKALLDIATHSMDWGSGFLDHEEVATLRRVAEAVGVDPIEVTPSEWRRQYAHEFKAVPPRPAHLRPIDGPLAPTCTFCHVGPNDTIHHGEGRLATGVEG